MKIYYSSKFEREYKKLSKEIKKLAEEKEAMFRKNSFNPQLNSHKLHGSFKDYWVFSVNDKYRIIFEFVKKDVIWFHSIGDHSVYQ